MGIQWFGITTTINMLKSIFFVAALVAAVHAEADAEPEADASTIAYHGLGYYGLRAPYSYNYGAYRHFGKRSANAGPEADAYTIGYHGLGYYGLRAPYSYNYGAYRHFGKRSADAPDAEPEANRNYGL